jgi:hypothetical protein
MEITHLPQRTVQIGMIGNDIFDAEKAKAHMKVDAVKLKHEFLFWLHLVLTVGSFAVPFLISWQLTVTALGLTILQHIFFGRCLLLGEHGVSEDDGSTFLSHLFERLGITPNKPFLRTFMRKFAYPALLIITLWWQVYLGHEPLWF